VIEEFQSVIMILAIYSVVSIVVGIAIGRAMRYAGGGAACSTEAELSAFVATAARALPLGHSFSRAV
jgi:hypothetical protein